VNIDGDFVMPFDDEVRLPDAEAFPTMAGGAHSHSVDSQTIGHETSSESAKATLKKRKRRPAKAFGVDERITLSNQVSLGWQNTYVQDHAAARENKEAARAKALAKKNAYALVFGNGIGNVGQGIGSSNFESPLSMFAGDSLRAMITGKEVLPSPRRAGRPKRSRTHDDNVYNSEEARRVRQRTSEDRVRAGRGEEDEGLILHFDDSTGLEVGRDAQPALDDHISSAIMPWNVSASLHSHRAGSSIIGRGNSALGSAGGYHSSLAAGKPGSRVTSASPLIGRGRHVSMLDEIERLDDLSLPPGFANSSVSGAAISQLQFGRSENQSAAINSLDEYELYGPAAVVDTQTAGTSQFIREAMARECMNLFNYVRNSIEELEIDILADDEQLHLSIEGRNAHVDMDEHDRRRAGKSIMFDAMIDPQENGVVVAAQAFLHVLTLATQGLLWVLQEEGEGDDFGRIRLGVRDFEIFEDDDADGEVEHIDEEDDGADESPIDNNDA